MPLLVLLTLHATQDSLDAHHELLHGEGLGDIVVGTKLEAFEDILLQRLGRQEDDRHLGVALTNLLSQRETVLLRHHHVEDADVVLLLEELTVANLAVRAQLTLEVLRLEVLAEQHSQILIISHNKIFSFSSIIQFWFRRSGRIGCDTSPTPLRVIIILMYFLIYIYS